MARHPTFRFCLDPTVEQQGTLARHAGAARFAFNQSLRLVKTAPETKGVDSAAAVPWTGFDLINAFNAWKKTEQAGRVFTVDVTGDAEVTVTGLAWRRSVCQQVFEEAAVDLGRALKSFTDSRTETRRGKRVGFPRFKTKARTSPSFRLRNRRGKGGRPAIRVGEPHHRAVTLPGIGPVRVHDDTRKLRRLLAKGRGKVLFATVTRRAGRWWVSLTVEAADLHQARQHLQRADGDPGGWAGVDRGLTTFAVAAASDGREIARVDDPPKPLAAGLARQRRLARDVTRKQKGSTNHRKAAARLPRHHHRVRNIRQHFLHQVTNRLVKTHDRYAIEDLNVAGMLANHRLARAISDASWAEFARVLEYKLAWRGGQLARVDRWFPSSKTCSACGVVSQTLTLADRVFTCTACGHTLDRDLNAAVNLATWAETHAQVRDPEARGPVTNACRQDGSGPLTWADETCLNDAGTHSQTADAA